MIIEKIVIKSFGLITDLTLEFSDSINVIEGQNESGKSTIAAFIKYMLYGFDGSDSEEAVSERKKRINWDTGYAQGSMYVRVGEKRYLITRSSTPTDSSQRTSYKEEASIIDIETGSPAFGKLSAGEVFFGVDRELFENTAFIGKIGDPMINEGSVARSIENILFSGSETINNQRAVAKISDKMQSLLRQGGSGGAIVELAAREDELLSKLEAANEDNKQILLKEAELHKIRRRRAEAEDKQAKLYELDSCYSNVMLIQTFDQLHDLEEELERRTEELNKHISENSKGDFAPDEEYLVNLATARKGVDEAYASLSDAQNLYTEQRRAVGITKEIETAIELSDSEGGEKKVKEAADFSRHGFIKNLGFAIASFAVVVAAIIFEIIAGVVGGNGIAMIAVAAAGVAALAGAGYFGYNFYISRASLNEILLKFGVVSYQDLLEKLSAITEARNKRDALSAATDSAKQAVENARERYTEAQNTLKEYILKWADEPPASDIGGYLNRLEANARAYIAKRNELYESKMNVEITVKEIRRTLSDKSEIDIRGQVSPLKRKALSGINHDEIINGIANSKARIAEEDRLAFEVENELMLIKGRAGDPGEYYSRIQNLAKRREDLQKKHKAYYIALGAIRGAADNLRAEISPRLSEYATALMQLMTGNKYNSFDVTDDLAVYFTDSNGERKSVEYLSGGTHDLAYVAVRAALIDMLYPEKPPICFDETFAHQDNVRARDMMKAIKALSGEGCQSFIFTCRGREATLANETVKGAGVFKLSVVEEERV